MSFLQDAKYGLLLLTLCGAGMVDAQKTQPQPVNDSAAQASPLSPTIKTPPTDASEQASPISDAHPSAGGIAPHTRAQVVLTEGADSGTLKNGQMIHAKLASLESSPRAGNTKHAAVKAGTPVILTVIATVPAGKLNAVGEMSLQLVQIGGQSVHTDIQTFRGKPGSRDLPDSAPTVGTNAGLAAGAELTFTIQPEPGFAEPAPRPSQSVPGSVTGLASGSKPSNFGQPTVSAAPGSFAENGATGSGANNGTQPAQNTGQGKATPNQPTSPTNASPNNTAQPH